MRETIRSLPNDELLRQHSLFLARKAIAVQELAQGPLKSAGNWMVDVVQKKAQFEFAESMVVEIEREVGRRWLLGKLEVPSCTD